MNNFCSDNFFLKSIFAPLFGLKSPKMLCAPQNINFPISGPILMIWGLFILLTEMNNFSSTCMQLLHISISLLSFMRHAVVVFCPSVHCSYFLNKMEFEMSYNLFHSKLTGFRSIFIRYMLFCNYMVYRWQFFNPL